MAKRDNLTIKIRNGCSHPSPLLSLTRTLLFLYMLAQGDCHLLSSNINLEFLATHTASKMELYLSEYISMNGKEPLLQRYVNDYALIMQESNREGADRYLSNPVNEYFLVKRMNDGNRILRDLISSNSSWLIHSKLMGENDRFITNLPTSDDVSEAAIGLVRLQTTFELATQDLAEGKLSVSSIGLNSTSRHRMTAGDCSELGRQAYLIGEDETAMGWMQESLSRYKQEADNEKSVRMEDILKYYAFSSLNQGHNAAASKLTRKLIQLLPGGHLELQNIFKLESELRASTIANTGHAFHDRDYKALCRGETVMKPIPDSPLHCSYTSTKELSAFMALQPIKREQISLNPPVTVFYDVISDDEIDILKSIAKPKFQAGLNANSVTGEMSLSQRRVFLNATMRDEDHIIVKKLSRRMENISGLKLTRDSFNIYQYGVGGHFIPHWDYNFMINETLLNVHKDNPVASWLFYLSEVEVGGATVFTEIKTAIRPVKGSASFWYNILPNGQGDPKTRHSGCPVLVGSKLILSKGFGYKAQMFRRPCRLNVDAKV